MATPGDEASDAALMREVGLCASCRHVRRVGNRRGSVFYRCLLADGDPHFPRYPRLPVLRCPGYEPGAPGGGGGDREGAGRGAG